MSSETGITPEPAPVDPVPAEPVQYDDGYGQEIGVGPHPLP
ncbi:hypothetical protein [Streptomyces sp. CB00316]|nr:hypothetical protein [Streptomyces sp. CB00316]